MVFIVVYIASSNYCVNSFHINNLQNKCTYKFSSVLLYISCTTLLVYCPQTRAGWIHCHYR